MQRKSASQRVIAYHNVDFSYNLANLKSSKSNPINSKMWACEFNPNGISCEASYMLFLD